uniref:BHLH domain-containing protein n=1 Tax=Ananas comosus var. bracteatus TaxID=296719 RepID=A0A6V7NTR0_ANACO|nr:unnamed protein product [Ananas comosus var. bracteatus]
MPLETSPATDHPDISDRALTALQSHREAERRRRERIKSHLDRLRTVLACDRSVQVDKASLLAKAVERVRELKTRTADIPGSARLLMPTETDEVIVLPTATANPTASVFEASVCCNDRSDLYSELVATLRSLRLKTLRAEIATVGGRVRSVLVLSREAGDDEEEEEENRHVDGEEEEEEEEEDRDVECGKGGGGDFLRDALRGLVHRPAPAADRSKRRRVVDRRST